MPSPATPADDPTVQPPDDSTAALLLDDDDLDLAALLRDFGGEAAWPPPGASRPAEPVYQAPDCLQRAMAAMDRAATAKALDAARDLATGEVPRPPSRD